MWQYETLNPDELMHYGKLGMKWGVRHGHSDKVYAKASRKLEKLDNKVQKYAKKKYKRQVIGSILLSLLQEKNIA